MAKDKSAAAETPATAPARRKKLPTTALLIGGITIVQAVGFFFAFKMFAGPPAATLGADGQHHAAGEDPKGETSKVTTEFALLEKLRVPNNKSGRMFMYDLDVFVVVGADRRPIVEKLKTERAAEVSDRLAQIVRAADPRILEEDDLRTLRMQMQSALSTISGDPELIQRVLIPRCVPIRAD
ncbi:MAG: hypothetical protein HRU75_08810 [Planctomycetia bacterium]|nr:MAG: hypothetical protein HRU75_08810 [Planctomycetia bacterium]